ncbi:hypothetical protein JYQ62_20470 [Nostoc sp. UHCC 0702]|nr:hypothetical protein JYQ62_20470 [Nostoc sp. UHCC 0702]
MRGTPKDAATGDSQISKVNSSVAIIFPAWCQVRYFDNLKSKIVSGDRQHKYSIKLYTYF